MSKPIIEVRNLSKKYILGERQPYYSLRDTLSSLATLPFKKDKLQRDEFWALKDVSFEINEGDVVGVIGRNGAGKSTLLKILSQITPPTEGEIKLRGRVASLLEVGTGFHPELTGRENVYLNGAILGMKRWEINNKFNEIVEFAEIEKFLDTPVKHYSSGMYMRLAFSVAAHLEPEILLVDEVLAVGDAQFQKKCLGKMSEVSKQGRTVIFVSHNIGAISELCKSCVLLKNGQVESIGEAKKVVRHYLSHTNNDIFVPKQNNLADMKITDVYSSMDKERCTTFGTIDKIKINSEVTINSPVNRSVLSVIVKDINQRKIFTEQIELSNNTPRDFVASFNIPKNFLTPGSYFVDFFIHVPNVVFIDQITDVQLFSVTDTGTRFNEYNGKDVGLIYTNFEWKINAK